MKNKLITILIAAAIALAMWFYVVTVVSPNSDSTIENIPVITQGEAMLMERGLMVTDTNIETATLHLEGNRTDLNKLNASNITVTMDVSRLDHAGTHDLIYNVSFPGDVASNAITVLSKNPSTIRVTVEERISKTIPVVVKYVGAVADSYTADKENMFREVETILVTGPKSSVDVISKAVITLDLEGRSESIDQAFSYVLCDMNDAPVSPEALEMVITDVQEVKLRLRIAKIQTLPLTVKLIEGGGATAQNTTVVIEPPFINISGSDAALENLSSLELTTLDLSTMTEDYEEIFTIKLPEGVVNETGITEAKVTVTFRDLETKTFSVKNIQAVNLPAGFTAELITQALEVTIRGPKAKIEQLTEENITVTLDLSEAEAGTVKRNAQIDCGDPELGAVGTYSVSATVKTSE